MTLLHWQNTSSLMMQWPMHGSTDAAVCLTHTKFHCKGKKEGRVGRSRKFEGRGHYRDGTLSPGARPKPFPSWSCLLLGYICVWWCNAQDRIQMTTPLFLFQTDVMENQGAKKAAMSYCGRVRNVLNMLKFNRFLKCFLTMQENKWRCDFTFPKELE